MVEFVYREVEVFTYDLLRKKDFCQRFSNKLQSSQYSKYLHYEP